MLFIARFSVILLSSLSLVSILSAQDSTFVNDAVILKNRETYIGILLESTSPDTVLLLVPDRGVLSFPRSTVATITKEVVTRDYIQPRERMDPKILIVPAVGQSFNRRFGTSLGVRLGYRHESRYYLGASFDFYSGNQAISPETQARTAFEETSSAAMFNVVVGREFGRGDWSIMLYSGFGITSLKSKVTYLEKPLYVETTYLEERVETIGVILGIHVSLVAIGPLAIGTDLRQQITFGQSPRSKEVPLTQRNENQTSLFVSVGVLF